MLLRPPAVQSAFYILALLLFDEATAERLSLASSSSLVRGPSHSR